MGKKEHLRVQSTNSKKTVPTINTRIRAIFCCIWFGIVPWQLYESEKHYEYDYFTHLKLNWGMVFFWITKWKIDEEELKFEKEVNPNWKVVFKNMWIGIR